MITFSLFQAGRRARLTAATGLVVVGWIVLGMVMLVNWARLAWSFCLLLGATIVGPS